MGDQTINKWAWIWAVVAVLAISAATYLYLHPRVNTVTTTQFKTVPQIQKVVDVQRVYVPVKQVVALDKQAVAQKLDMPWLTPAATPAAPAAASPAPAPIAAGEPLPSAPTAAAQVEPAPVAGDPQDLQVTATADIPESDDGYEAVSILNTATGESMIVAKEKPPELFSFENRGELGAWYGYNNHLLPSIDFTGQWTFLRVMKAHIGLRTDLGSQSGALFQAGALYQW